MTNEFAGRIIGVKCVKVIGNIAYALIIKFKDEMLLSLLPKENKGEYIKEMISKYNLGVANTEPFFIYDNHEDVIYARFNLILRIIRYMKTSCHVLMILHKEIL